MFNNKNNQIEEKLIDIVNETLDELYFKERYLFEHNLSERNKVFHFARYFITVLEKNDVFDDYDIDCEYNGNSLDEAKYKSIYHEDKKARIYPDFILHQRGSNDYNLLAIEFKTNKSKSSSYENDFYKLKVLTTKHLGYNYRLGLFIKLSQNRESVEIIKFIDGVMIDEINKSIK